MHQEDDVKYGDYSKWERIFFWWPKKLSNGTWLWWRYAERRYYSFGCIAGGFADEIIRLDSKSPVIHHVRIM